MPHPIEFQNVWKKFKRGEKFNSMRDAVPNFFKKVVKTGGNGQPKLSDQEFWAVKDVSFHVKKGEVVGIIGPNGAGKSTILKLLSGIIIPNQGSLQLNGRLSALIEVTAGFHPELTGRENIYLNGTILGMKRREIDEKFDEIVDFSGIADFIDTPVKRYSSGMFSRLGFSVAAHVNPEILLVDEVLAVGDIAFQSKCAQKMRDLLKSGVTIILVSHSLPLVQNLCQRVILINKGQVLREGPPDVVIPYYENLIFEEQEDEFKRRLTAPHKVKVDGVKPVEIKEVSIRNASGAATENFKVGDTVSITATIESKLEINDPMICVELERADGILCCFTSNRDANFPIKEISGKQQFAITFEDVTLLPGVYLAKISIWDKDIIHPFDIRKQDVFRIQAQDQAKYTHAIFMPKTSWKKNLSTQI